MTDASDFLITADELAALDPDHEVRIIDARSDLSDPGAGQRMYAEGHIPGAAYCDLDQDLAGPVTASSGRHPLPQPETVASKLGAIGIDLQTPVVCYDAASGALAARAWWLLRWLGHPDVRLLDGGLAAWQAAGRALQAESPRFERREFKPQPNAAMIISTDEIVERSQGSEVMTLIDARDSARFRGEVEPIDTVAGHVPGAMNVPFSESIDQRGGWKSRSELRQLWRKTLGADEQIEWAVMCGSGVTACHLAISALQAGYNEPRLYVGSWSEWIRDSGRPIAVGREPDGR